jgi:hypothetical protein
MSSHGNYVHAPNRHFQTGETFSDLQVRATVMALPTLTESPCFSLGRYSVHRQAATDSLTIFPFDHMRFSFYAA